MGYGSPMGHMMPAMTISRPSAVGRQLFVSNLDFDVTWQELKDHFKDFDVQVSSCDFATRAPAVGTERCWKWSCNAQRAEVTYDGEGRSKGFGTVRFGTPAEAQRALQMMNHSPLRARLIELREDARAS
jgi:RNA recognition motif-containing protein